MPYVFSMMVKLGFASPDIPPEKQLGLKLKDEPFRPSEVPPLLAPKHA
jgi:hypothetical protein